MLISLWRYHFSRLPSPIFCSQRQRSIHSRWWSSSFPLLLRFYLWICVFIGPILCSDEEADDLWIDWLSTPKKHKEASLTGSDFNSGKRNETLDFSFSSVTLRFLCTFHYSSNPRWFRWFLCMFMLLLHYVYATLGIICSFYFKKKERKMFVI